MDISHQQSKGVTQFMGHMRLNYAIFVCHVDENQCPKIFPFTLQYLRWPFQDPTTVSGTEEEQLVVFRRVRDEIRAAIRDWLASLPAAQDA